jgi:transcriptional regulator with XRE-family HTH domain
MIYSIEELVKKIKIGRKKKGLSQRALSSKIHVPQSHISKIENGMVDLQTSSLIEIARALDLELILVPRNLLPAINAMQNTSLMLNSTPAYQLSNNDDCDDD